jgi:hypothetical protein
VVLSSGQQTTVAVKLATTTPGAHNGALVVSATGCADLTVGLTGNVTADSGGGGGGRGGGCSHGAGGLLAVLAPLLALATLRRRTR